DIIAEITPITFIAENKYMKVAEVKVNKNHKGRLDTENSVHLPAFVEVDKEYLVYLTNDDGMLIVNSIDNCVINKSDQQKWNEAMKLSEDQRNETKKESFIITKIIGTEYTRHFRGHLFKDSVKHGHFCL